MYPTGHPSTTILSVARQPPRPRATGAIWDALSLKRLGSNGHQLHEEATARIAAVIQCGHSTWPGARPRRTPDSLRARARAPLRTPMREIAQHGCGQDSLPQSRQPRAPASGRQEPSEVQGSVGRDVAADRPRSSDRFARHTCPSRPNARRQRPTHLRHSNIQIRSQKEAARIATRAGRKGTRVLQGTRRPRRHLRLDSRSC